MPLLPQRQARHDIAGDERQNLSTATVSALRARHFRNPRGLILLKQLVNRCCPIARHTPNGVAHSHDRIHVSARQRDFPVVCAHHPWLPMTLIARVRVDSCVPLGTPNT